MTLCDAFNHSRNVFFLVHYFNVWRYLRHTDMCSIGTNNWWHPHSGIGRCSPIGEGKQHSRQQDEWCRCYIYNVDKSQEDGWNGSWPSWHPQREGGKYSEKHRCIVQNYLECSRVMHVFRWWKNTNILKDPNCTECYSHQAFTDTVHLLHLVFMCKNNFFTLRGHWDENLEEFLESR